MGPKIVSREYALVCLGRFVSRGARMKRISIKLIDYVRLVGVARGEQEYFDPSGIPTATEGCKSNALMRCCKDLGIASELWLVGDMFLNGTNLTRYISTQTGTRGSFESSRQSTV